jgi:predicted HTH domain antitoxin
VFVALPFDQTLLESGVGISLVIELFASHHATLAQAARMVGAI